MAIATATAIIISTVVTVAVAAATTALQMSAQAAAQDDQAKAQRRQADLFRQSAEVADENAQKNVSFVRRTAEMDALDQEDAAVQAEKAAAVRGAQVRAQARRLLARQGSIAGAAGVVAHEGSLLTNEVDAADLAEFNAQIEEFPGLLDAYSLRREAFKTRFRGDAEASRLLSDNALNQFNARAQASITDYSASLLRTQASRTRAFGSVATGIAAVGGAARVFNSFGGSSGSSTP